MSGDKPDLEHGVYRVTHNIIVGSKRLIAESDLIFVDGHPFVVLEWAGSRENQHPGLTVALDPAQLEERPGPPGYFLCNGDVVDPRTPH
jgi:hypothetical protein